MSGERSLSPSAKPRMERGSGVSVDVGVGADRQGAVNLRGGATFMKSVSIFLMSGRKASVNSNRQTSSSASPKQEPRKRHRRRMPVPATARTSVYTVKLIESLKRKTRFSWRVKIDLWFVFRAYVYRAGNRSIISTRNKFSFSNILFPLLFLKEEEAPNYRKMQGIIIRGSMISFQNDFSFFFFYFCL